MESPISLAICVEATALRLTFRNGISAREAAWLARFARGGKAKEKGTELKRKEKIFFCFFCF